MNMKPLSSVQVLHKSYNFKRTFRNIFLLLIAQVNELLTSNNFLRLTSRGLDHTIYSILKFIIIEFIYKD